MKLSHISSCILLLLSASLHGAIYSSSFTGLGSNDVAGFEGWTINDPEPTLSFGTTFGPVNEAAGLGGYNVSPNEATVGLSHGYGETFGYTVASFTFAITDSTNLFPGRDKFSFSFSDGATNLFSVLFTPTVPGETNPDGDLNAAWTLSYSTGAGASVPLNISVAESGAYVMSFSFSPNGGSTDFSLGVGALGGDPLDTLVRTGTLTGLNPLTASSDFALGFIPSAGSGGDNYIAIDDISVVPEPSSALLLGVVGLGLVSRRRRA
jgi:hypothetical protein